MVQARTSTAFNLCHSELPGVKFFPGSYDREFLELQRQALAGWLKTLAEQIVLGKHLSREDAIAVSHIEGEENILLLCATANKIRQSCCGIIFYLGSIINIQLENCSVNCGFCSQSVARPVNDSPIYWFKSYRCEKYTL